MCIIEYIESLVNMLIPTRGSNWSAPLLSLGGFLGLKQSMSV